MDFMYAFRQSNVDRREEFGSRVEQHQLVPVTRHKSQSLHQRIRRQLTALLQVEAG